MTQRRLPSKATTALGEEAAAELAEWVTDEINIVYQQSVSRDEYRKLLSRIDILEHDVSDLKVEVKEFRRETNMRLDAMEERFDARFDHLQSEMNARFDRLFNQMNARFDRMGGEMDARFGRMSSDTDARFDHMSSEMDTRFGRMSSEMEARFGRMGSDTDARFDHMSSEMEARFGTVNQRIDALHDVIRSQTRWLVGTLIAVGGLISVLITIFNFIS